MLELKWRKFNFTTFFTKIFLGEKTLRSTNFAKIEFSVYFQKFSQTFKVMCNSTLPNMMLRTFLPVDVPDSYFFTFSKSLNGCIY